jgi:transketolase
MELFFVPALDFENLNPRENREDFIKVGYAARLNALSMIKAAGSGHIGSSFSCIDLALAIQLFILNRKIHVNQNLKDIFFTSKGHDAPGIYAVEHAFGAISDQELFKLRRLGGLPGHPEIGVAGGKTNTGSLGMGISKAKGFAYAALADGLELPNVVTLLGDGELQEGQVWESLLGAARDKLNNVIAFVDGNKIQSDTWVEKTLPLGNLKSRVEGSGWKYIECSGHDYLSLKEACDNALNSSEPVFVYAHTKKASGVSFMETFDQNGLFYKYHSGSPSDMDYLLACKELTSKINSEFEIDVNFPANQIHSFSSKEDDFTPKSRNPLLIQDWSSFLVEEFNSSKKLFALDADLSFDTGTYEVARRFPDRYLQCGIAEQDMVSIAGTLAVSGYIPVVHSFASFLTTRAAEQIFNNLTEKSKIIYAGFLAGILPSAPGHSHQSVIDVGIISSMQLIDIYEPSCKGELELSLKSATQGAKSSYIRIGSVDYPNPIDSKTLNLNQLVQRRNGARIALITSGPTMLRLALEIEDEKSEISIFTYPRINKPFMSADIENLIKFEKIFVLENYLPTRGLHVNLQESMKIHGKSIQISRIGIENIPKNGWPDEVLKYHELDSIALKKILLNV